MQGDTATLTRTVNVLLLGPPGAGKGTQAELLVKSHGLVQLSTGDMLREAKASGSELRQRVADVMERGELVTDDIVIGLIKEKLSNTHAKGFIFDGFPRTLAQADALGQLLEEFDIKLDAAIELKVDDKILVQRILHRAAQANAAGQPVRADDNEETLVQRLEAYHAQTAPLIAYYEGKGVLKSVDAMGAIDAIAKELSAIVS